MDATFGGGDGVVITDIGGNNDYSRGVVLHNNGNILLAGKSGSDFILARYEGDPIEVSITATGTPTEAGATAATFTIDRGADTNGDITVFFDITGTAEYNIDYILEGVRTIDDVPPPVVTFNRTTNKGSVVIPDGQTSVDIQLIPRDDTVADGAETVIITLTEEPTECHRTIWSYYNCRGTRRQP